MGWIQDLGFRVKVGFRIFDSGLRFQDGGDLRRVSFSTSCGTD